MGVLTLLDIRPKFPIEDDWVAAQLVAYGIEPTQLMQRLGLTSCKGVPAPDSVPYRFPPHPENNVVASWEHTPEQMVEIHEAFKYVGLKLT
jgi:hypothetical protein